MNRYEMIYSRDFDVENIPHCWIQWKGTNVCMDVHCACGFHGHVDDSFVYYYECPECKQLYAVGQNIKLIPLYDEIANETKEKYRDVIKTDSNYVEQKEEDELIDNWFDENMKKAELEK